MMTMHNPPNHIVFHGGNMETLDYEVELGRRAAFDLYHHDITLYCAHGQTEIDSFCYRGCEPTVSGWKPARGSASS